MTTLSQHDKLRIKWKYYYRMSRKICRDVKDMVYAFFKLHNIFWIFGSLVLVSQKYDLPLV